MDASGNVIDWQTWANLCRCCLAPGCYKDLSTEYFCSGQSEVYSDMLKETFDIEFSYQDGANHSPRNRQICEVCVLRLQEAAAFKRRAQDSEAKVVEFFAALRDSVKEPEITSAANVIMEVQTTSVDSWDGDGELIIDESVKTEECASFDGDNYTESVKTQECDNYSGDNYTESVKTQECDNYSGDNYTESVKTGDCDSYDGDNYIDKSALLVIVDNESASKTKSEREGEECPPEERPTQSISRPLDFYRETSAEVQTIDRPKVVKSRSKSSVVRRDNTLKMIANSTMCVFQWSFGSYRCFCCHEPYSDMTALREHTSMHTLKTIEKKIILQQNRLVKVDITLLYCKLCYTNLPDLTELRHHLIYSHEVKILPDDLLVPFKLNCELKCQICGVKFSLFQNLNKHMNKHYQKHVCNICGAGSANLAFLNIHIARAHRAPHCAKCNQEFSSKAEKKKHNLTVHSLINSSEAKHPCPDCDQSFYEDILKVKHMIEKHGSRKPQHKCNRCGRTFLTINQRESHMNTVHFKDKRVECDACHLKFYSKSDLSLHKVVHRGNKNYECNVCHSMFVSAGFLKRHLKKHMESMQ